MNNVVYIISSQTTGRRYIGYTGDIEKRLCYHNAGKNHSTKRGRPWKLIYSENYADKQLALRREKELKSFKGGNSLSNLLKQAGIV